MNITVNPGIRSGKAIVPASKSVAHRELICSALAGEDAVIECCGVSKDICATGRCLSAMGASVNMLEGNMISVRGITSHIDGVCDLMCGESGSTLRFLMPVVGALGIDACFHMEGLLSKRPHTVLIDVLREHGMNINQEGELLKCSGKLTPGDYTIPGDISSQFISGLLFALPMLDRDSTITVTGVTESASYIELTLDALGKHGITVQRADGGYSVPGNQKYTVDATVSVERDWSSAAFFLCMGALSAEGIELSGMRTDSVQGDMKILDVLRQFGAQIQIQGSSVRVSRGELKPLDIDARDIPDLVPTIAALSCAADGTTVIRGAKRLRFKESDRLESTAQLIRSLGGRADVEEDGLTIYGTGILRGGSVECFNDHRIAMSAAVASCICEDEVLIKGAECVSKSFPDFFDELLKLRR